MAITANGYIFGENDDTSWVSPEDFESQAKVAKRAGNIVYGRRTYDIGVKENTVPVLSCLNVVVTSKSKQMETKKHFLFTDKKPRAIIKMLEEKGFSEILVAGGSILNNAFIKENLIDEIYLDIEPIILGKGSPLFVPTDIKLNLKLLELNKLSDQTIQLHYQVVKK